MKDIFYIVNVHFERHGEVQIITSTYSAPTIGVMLDTLPGIALDAGYNLGEIIGIAICPHGNENGFAYHALEGIKCAAEDRELGKINALES